MIVAFHLCQNLFLWFIKSYFYRRILHSPTPRTKFKVNKMFKTSAENRLHATLVVARLWLSGRVGKIIKFESIFLFETTVLRLQITQSLWYSRGSRLLSHEYQSWLRFIAGYVTLLAGFSFEHTKKDQVDWQHWGRLAATCQGDNISHNKNKNSTRRV